MPCRKVVGSTDMLMLAPVGKWPQFIFRPAPCTAACAAATPLNQETVQEPNDLFVGKFALLHAHHSPFLMDFTNFMLVLMARGRSKVTNDE
jgi:hypothetical protein